MISQRDCCYGDGNSNGDEGGFVSSRWRKAGRQPGSFAFSVFCFLCGEFCHDEMVCDAGLLTTTVLHPYVIIVGVRR